MKVIFTGRHVEVSDSLRASTQERLDKMTNYLDDIIDVHVIFSVEKHRHQAEITLKTRRSDFVACAETDDMYLSLSQALDKLEAQAHKQAGKQKAGVKAKTAAAETAEGEAEPETGTEAEAETETE
ncbi:MAG: ribosome-associated translation inhibitor RaiA [Holophaga sp.]|nr:ribosome-associated translation inhibitor RaiA [Holophaga sp.]